MRWDLRLVAIVAVASSPAFASPAVVPPTTSSPVFRGEQIVARSEGGLPAPCWTKLPGSANEYALARTAACLATLRLTQVTVARHDDGTFDIDNKETPVQRIFGPTADEVSPSSPVGDQGPFVLVLGDNTLVRALAIALAKPPEQVVVGPPITRPCDWSGHDDGDVAIDLVRGPSVVRAPPRNVMRPNQGLVVHVCHSRLTGVTVQWGGARGMTRAVVDGPTQAERGDADKRAGAGLTISRLTFPPRKPGSADLKVFDGTDAAGKPALEIELEVEPLYWGAVRFGLGTLFGSWTSYEIATFAGSRQAELRRLRDTATFEIVSGFAPYVFDLGSGGRSHTGGNNAFVAPFIGFGVLGVAPDKAIQGLSSFQIGLEVEVASNFSIAATFAYRRTRALAAGYELGTAIPASTSVDDVTVDAWAPGFGIVVNTTPGFLQFATGTPSSGGDK